MPKALLAEYLDYIKRTHEAEKKLHRASLKQLQAEDNVLAEKLNRLADLLIESHIDQKLFEIKNKKISLRHWEINCVFEDNLGADEKFKDALCKVIGLAAKSYDLFESSKTDEKRGLLGFVFLNLQLEGATLRGTLRRPFEPFAKSCGF